MSRKDGTVMLNSADAETLEAIRDICTALGVVTYSRTTLMRRGFGAVPSALHRIHFVPGSLASPLFLLRKARERFAAHSKRYSRLGWTITSIDPTDRVEPVYCAEVAGEHAFALDDNILTGNCFGCGAHGDAIRWMTDQRGLPFIDAVKELADAAGLAMPAPDPRAAERQAEQRSLRDVTEAAAAWYRERLADSEGAEARAYLAKRGLTKATIDAFALGFAPDARGRMRDLLKPFGDAMAVEAGMLIAPPVDSGDRRDDVSSGTANERRDDVSSGKTNQKRDPYDRFRGRLMIPIRDPRGRVIAFGGRILEPGEPKYLNSPETPIFDKGRTLYNLDRAAPAARKAGRLVIVEGYMDVIALAQAGIEEAVAPLGTALTEQQIELAWRQVPVPLLAFDGDGAGQRAALRAAMRALPLLKPGHSLAFVTLPPGQDPDDVVRSGGRAAMGALLAGATHLVDLLWTNALREATSDTPEERAAVRFRLMAAIDTIGDSDVAAHYRSAIRDRLDAAFFAPKRRVVAGRTGAPWRTGNIAPERPPTARLRGVGVEIEQRTVEAIVVGLLRYPELLSPHAEALTRLSIVDPATAALLDALLGLAFDGRSGVDSQGLLAILAPMSVYPKAMELLRADMMSFSFTRAIDDPAADGVDLAAAVIARDALRRRATRDLAAAIDAVVALPDVVAALSAATDAARTTLDAASYAEQQRLLGVKADLAARIAALRDFEAA